MGFRVKEVEVENSLDHDISFDLVYFEADQKLKVKIAKPEEFKFALRRSAYRREDITKATIL